VMASYQARHDKLKGQYPKLYVQRLTRSIIHNHTVIRDGKSTRKDFINYSKRILRSLLDDALCLLPFEQVDITTPTQLVYQGLRIDTVNICGVSILRSGASMEGVFRETVKDVPLGHILIQRDESSKDKAAKLMYVKLPPDIANRRVLLLDPMLATGGSAISAITVLVERGVPVENIIFVNLVSCPEGIDKLFAKYPTVTLVTSMIDEGLNEHKYILPGLGDFGDRFYGTS